MKKFIALTALLTAFIFSFGQNTLATGDRPLQQQKLDELKGTYALKSTSRMAGMLPSDLADIIIRNRKANEINRIKLSEEVELIIFPANEISHDSKKIKQ